MWHHLQHQCVVIFQMCVDIFQCVVIFQMFYHPLPLSWVANKEERYFVSCVGDVKDLHLDH